MRIPAIPLVILLAVALGLGAMIACSDDAGGGGPSTDDAGHHGDDAENTSTCGGLHQSCCPENSCTGDLSCQNGVCIQSPPGDVGKPCERNADCDSELCLPVGDGTAVCTEPCSSTSECVPGWQCEPLSGVATDVCTCEVQPETCSGMDDNCDGIVDNYDIVQDACGSSGVCEAGECVCLDEDTGETTVCGANEMCAQGQCVCIDECGGHCVDVNSDRQNCGGCGIVCPDGGWCEQGKCHNELQVDVGGDFACALTSLGEILCWSFGDDDDHPVTTDSPSGGSYVQISAGSNHACAITVDGDIVCWGGNEDGQSNPPEEGSFVQVSAGRRLTCALSTAGEIQCWGQPFGQLAEPPADSFAQVSVGWGDSLGRVDGCGVTTSGEAKCWGVNGSGATNPPDDAFADVSVGGMHFACGVTTSGELKCWGIGLASSDTFVQAGAGYQLACGLTLSGKVECSRECPGCDEISSSYDISRFSMGYNRLCGVTTAEEIVCWSRLREVSTPWTDDDHDSNDDEDVPNGECSSICQTAVEACPDRDFEQDCLNRCVSDEFCKQFWQCMAINIDTTSCSHDDFDDVFATCWEEPENGPVFLCI